MCYRTQAQIDLDAIEYNYNSVRSKVGDSVKILGLLRLTLTDTERLKSADSLRGNATFSELLVSRKQWN